MNIELLIGHPEYVQCICRWIYDEFVIPNNPQYPFEKLTEFFGHKRENEFPITYIAIDHDKCVGTVSIFQNDLNNQKELTPWLASLYVTPEFRNKKIGEKLIEKVICRVKDMGYEELFLRTEHAAEYYLKKGWEFVYKTVDNNGVNTEVYKLHIG